MPTSTATPLKSATNAPKVETDDGFKTFNEIPVAPAAPPPTPTLSPEETSQFNTQYGNSKKDPIIALVISLTFGFLVSTDFT